MQLTPRNLQLISRMQMRMTSMRIPQRMLAVLATAVFLTAASADVAVAQAVTTTGQIRGRVLDDNGAAVAAATITARNVQTGLTRSARTTADGLYTVRLLPPGIYSVEARSIGFQARAANNIVVRIGNATPLNFGLTRAAVQLEDITVTAEAAQIDRSDGGVKQLVTQEEIRELPSLGRDFVDFINLSGLVAPDEGETTGGQFSIAGQRASQTNLQIDGVDANNSFFGENRGGSRIPFSFSLESIREFQIITNGFDVEFGKFSGGIINVVTQGGTNDLEATVYGNFRSDFLTGSPFINDPTDPEITTDYSVQQFSGRISGPIVRDKAFFLFSADGQRRREPQLPLSRARFLPGGEQEDAAVAADLGRYFSILENQYGIANAASGYQPFETSNDEIVLFGRVDWNLNENHRVSSRLNYQDFRNHNEWDGNFDYAYGLSRAEKFDDRAVSWVSELQSTLGRTSFNVLRFQISNEKRPRQGNDLRPTLTVNLSNGVLAQYGGSFASYNNNLEETKFQVIDNFTKVMGDHTFKVGGNLLYTKILNEFQNFGSQFQGAGEFRFANLDDFENYRPSSYYRPIQLGGGIPTSRFSVVEWALYAQDLWQVTPKLAATIGLRYDLQSFRDSPTPVVDVERAFGYTTGFAPTDKNNISPRLSLAYDINGDGGSVLRAGIGYFYGSVPFVVGGNVLQTERPVLEVICNGSIADGDPDAPPSPAGYSGWSTDGLQGNPTTCASTGAGGVPTYTVWNEDFAFPESVQGNIGYETLLGDKTRISVDFLYSRTSNLYTVRNLNLRDQQFTLTGEGGRRVFTPTAQFNPSGANSTGARRNLQFGDVLVNYNDGRAQSFIGKVEVNHQFNANFQARGEYTYNSTFDNSPYSCCTAGGGYADPTTGAFGPNEIGDVGEEDHAWGRSDYARRHSLVGSGILRFPTGFGNIRLSAFWKSQSGRPWTVVGNGDLNGDGVSYNDRVFVFSAANLPLASAGTADEQPDRDAYQAILDRYSCVGDHEGELIPRNTCTYPWRHQLDMRVTFGVERIFGAGGEVSFDFFNVLNGLGSLLCDKNAADYDPTSGACGWGRVTGVFGSNRDLLSPRGFDAVTGETQYSVNRTFGQEDLLGSNLVLQFQMQVGVRLFF